MEEIISKPWSLMNSNKNTRMQLKEVEQTQNHQAMVKQSRTMPETSTRTTVEWPSKSSDESIEI